MLSVDSTNRLNRVCLLMKQVELSIRRIICFFRLVFCSRISPTQSGKSEATRPSRVCELVPINGEPVVLCCRLASCVVRLSGCQPSGCQPAVLYCWPHTVRGLAVLRASGEQESQEWTMLPLYFSLFRCCA